MSKSYQAEITMNHFYYLLFVAEFTFAYDMIVEIDTNLFVRLKNNTGHILKITTGFKNFVFGNL